MKWIEHIFNALFWVITGWLITSSFSIQGQEIEIINDQETIRTIRDDNLIHQLLVCIVISAMMFYANLHNLTQLKADGPKTQSFLISVCLFTLALLVYWLIEQRFFHELLLPKQITFGVVFFYLAVSMSYGLFKVWIQSQRREQNLILAKKQAELNLLRNQLQPHFLFNALNNLLSLVNQEKSPQLSASFEHLSALLRHVIDENKSPAVPLEKEIAFIKNYCELQLLRFEAHEVKLKLSVIGDVTNKSIEPGLFIPFVENAFKYGAAPELETTIKIVFKANKTNEMTFLITNQVIDSLQQNKGAGTGISAARERLELVYPKQHTLFIEDSGVYQVNLKINLP
ncbi:sensor histidine kinase [Marinicella meishanensis]|uniref:sensor histidine kinase n=1 Tax=Marinicella meishanensis TaxID=2873263 RepID=UPI001CBEB7F6|nr:histidine kinase [Marinicella sp. NBU2979]